jgi:hypothetical protein
MGLLLAVVQFVRRDVDLPSLPVRTGTLDGCREVATRANTGASPTLFSNFMNETHHHFVAVAEKKDMIRTFNICSLLSEAFIASRDA